MNFDYRHLIDAQHIIAIEVLLLHAAAIDRDGAFQSGAEAVNYSTLQLLLDDMRVHDVPAIDGAHYAVDTQFAVREGNFGDLRRKTSDVVVDTDAARSTIRERLAPAGFLGRQFEHGQQTRRFRQQAPAQFQRIFTTGGG